MNQVSWTRILQRAGDELPSEGGADIINMRERAAERQKAARHPAPPDRDAGDLESELQYALNRAAQRGRAANPPRPVPQPPFPDERARRHAEGAMPVAASPYLQTSLTRAPRAGFAGPAKRSGSGLRNVVAISFSVAVIAFAYNRMSAEWTQSSNEKSATEEGSAADTRAAPVLYSGGVSRNTAHEPQANSAAATSANTPVRLDLRPSIAPDNSAEKRATQAANAVASLDNGSEQVLLRRGHELMERGHVANARLIFEHLVEQKSALGAFALAQSYDPHYLASSSVPNADPDEMQAAYWYQRAVELGMNTADLR